MVAIIDYKSGNIRSVKNALDRLGYDSIITNCEYDIERATHIILPGVGDAYNVMNYLIKSDLYSVIKSARSPVLGICIGMQILCASSQEGSVQCLNLFDIPVNKLECSQKLPHMGWNRVYDLRSPLFNGVMEGEWFYFVHSYAPILSQNSIATTNYGVEFSAALNKQNFYGTQFHPEKSGDIGLKVLSNFLIM